MSDSRAMVVLDAWAVLAMTNRERSGHAVLRVVETQDARMSSINLGEVAYRVMQLRGPAATERTVRETRALVRVEDPDLDLVLAAARLKARGGISYADCFGVATAQRHGEPIVTGDPEIVALHGADGLEVIDPR